MPGRLPMQQLQSEQGECRCAPLDSPPAAAGGKRGSLHAVPALCHGVTCSPPDRENGDVYSPRRARSPRITQRGPASPRRLAAGGKLWARACRKSIRGRRFYRLPIGTVRGLLMWPVCKRGRVAQGRALAAGCAVQLELASALSPTLTRSRCCAWKVGKYGHKSAKKYGDRSGLVDQKGNGLSAPRDRWRA